ncbi:MAG: NAD-dependent epimerase/dehydratase family protein [Microbacterium sp.]|uniref:NAD-dependent epimerase/dehydratase family protein n=1 Tax=Microbacterium sp. TaxID=51671 RepID=UPI00271EF1A7|nr:NAD-dependent epimerase/dehydratase family protein [Microbacterium sp.]MDO8381396.1 NAD-dependent epimerase/dehydratase family protein [Microbacterium sp.]
MARTRDDAPLTAPIRWADADRARDDLAAGMRELVSSDANRIEVYWCAGRGVTSSAPSQLDAEFDTFDAFLRLLLALPEVDRSRLAVFLASSVGGAYAAAPLPPFTEATPPAPSSAYGRTKLRMEAALAEATLAGGWRSFVARITNLYGPGQDLAKGQGLLSVIVASYVTHRPVSIYVSLDTLRDYIYEDDCARVVDAAMLRVAAEPAGTIVTKIVGAMTAQSIGAILGENTKLRRRRPRVILGQGDPRGQANDLRVRSEVWTDLDALVRTTIPEGLNNLYLAQLAELGRGSR